MSLLKGTPLTQDTEQLKIQRLKKKIPCKFLAKKAEAIVLMLGLGLGLGKGQRCYQIQRVTNRDKRFNS